ncbi:substrate-binding domain-containing protein [Cellulomonas sp. URHE0023]|uniref:substrate-binding domain-containing protein n=1 Tax=Cellulomonas sp. URHE0023 TaxID=1380354 RepID=UPI000483417D|nr:substrate-binding domain-containing protein [Cellulomonas sp. URHE0023]
MSDLDQRGPLQATRRAQVLEALRRDGSVRVSDLTRELGVTAVTVRRDIAQLADEGLVQRVHGGATLVGPAVADEAPAAPADGERRRPHARDLGMLVPSLDYYWPDVVRGAEEVARENGLRIRLRGSSYESVDDRPQLERFVARGSIAGLLVAPRLESPRAATTLEWLASTGLPTVLVERQATVGDHHAPMESVMTDHALGAAMAVRHLVALGHTKVGLVTNTPSPTSPHVRRGWFEAALEAGFSIASTVDAEVPNPSHPTWDTVVDDVIAQCRRTGTTALLVHADAEAIALVQRCERHHLSVPGDLSVVAYDDTVAGLFSPALTAVRPPRSSVGHAAVELLVARMADPGRPAHRVLISPALHVRDSSAPPPAR